LSSRLLFVFRIVLFVVVVPFTVRFSNSLFVVVVVAVFDDLEDPITGQLGLVEANQNGILANIDIPAVSRAGPTHTRISVSYLGVGEGWRSCLARVIVLTSFPIGFPSFQRGFPSLDIVSSLAMLHWCAWLVPRGQRHPDHVRRDFVEQDPRNRFEQALDRRRTHQRETVQGDGESEEPERCMYLPVFVSSVLIVRRLVVRYIFALLGWFL